MSAGPDQYAHILRQSRHSNWTATTETATTVNYLTALFLTAAATATVSPVRAAAAGSGLAPAACQLSSGFYRCVTSVWLSPSLESEERKRERDGAQNGREQFPHCGGGERERDMGGEGCGSAECFHFDQFYTLSIFFFPHHKDNLVTSVRKTSTCQKNLETCIILQSGY